MKKDPFGYTRPSCDLGGGRTMATLAEHVTSRIENGLGPDALRTSAHAL
jgi:hypothetical protein